MIQRPDFDSKEVDPDLHKRMARAVDDGRIKCINMREGPADGDQDLNLWLRELEDVVREIMADPIFKGNQFSILKWTSTSSVRGCLGARQMLEYHFRLAN